MVLDRSFGWKVYSKSEEQKGKLYGEVVFMILDLYINI